MRGYEYYPLMRCIDNRLSAELTKVNIAAAHKVLEGHDNVNRQITDRD